MALVARGDNRDSVTTNHLCDATTTTDECSPDVFVCGYGVVRAGDNDASHLIGDDPPCSGHTVAMSASMSTSVKANGNFIAMKNSGYGGEIITTINAEQTTVFAT